MGYITKVDCEGNKPTKIKLCTSLTFGLIFLMITALTIILEPISITSRYIARMDSGTLMHEALKRETDSVHLSLYLFNITNAEQFVNGEDEKLKVQEVGPFTYQENRTNEDLEIDHEAGVVRYTPRHKVTFLPEESIGDPKDIILTLPNIAMLSMASKVTNYGYFAKMGFNMLARRLDSNATVTINAHDYMWGFDEPLIRLGNQIMPGWINFEKLGLLDRLYDNKTSIRLEVSSRDSDKFMVKTVNGVAGLKQWGYEENKTRSKCNSFTDAYEGLCYPPELAPTRRIRLYRNVLCRFLDLDYHGTTKTDLGFEGLLYKISNSTYRNIPENQCLCSNGICHDGISDISPCMYGLPIVLSNAHFMDTDPKIYDRIEGFTPNEEEHGSEFIIEKTIGMVMTTRFSVQVNIMMQDVGFNSKISRFSDMFVPVGYFKIVQPKLTEETLHSLRLIHIYSPYLLLTTQILFTAAGLLLISQSAKLLYYNWIYDRRKGLSLHLQSKDTKEASAEPLMR
ncbi:unnamed protein product [Arctia plantaginis]|uniref:Scavenger receptor class B member 1 n=1 Tax=Arctia plantaginis TaxID=874455 RepID=A0A8S0Z554_ARCPL|nr:unnamed protein product [Arctia plantaginis]CAB3235108.1 unnamed protein product [Arctia plantaginis]